jgi:hypothetical protein
MLGIGMLFAPHVQLLRASAGTEDYMKMKQITLLFLVAILLIPVAATAGVMSPARMVLVDGDVMFRTPDDDEWLPVAMNTPLDEGDALWVSAGSKTEIQFADGSIVRVDGDSQLDLIAIEEDFTHLHLASGRLYLRTALKTANNSLQIDADDTTVLPDARTRLRIDMLANRQEDVSIFKGSAYVEGNGNRTKVRAGEHIALEDGHSELLPLNPPDSWEKWNSERDRSQSRTTAESNLPDELLTYSAELQTHGTWVQAPQYGLVWRPTVILSDDWAPYRSGRWIWKGDDYVWISSEKWGWAPYHFGRWAVVSGFGWCWVPPARGDIYWGPGYVGWYRSDSHVGWTPLAPGETFFVRRNYGRHSVNGASGTVNTAPVIYKNRAVQGGFSLVLKNDFLRGRAHFQQMAHSKDAAISLSTGSSRLELIRETRMPIITQTPPLVAPPSIQRRDTRELQARFPRVTSEAQKQHRPQSSIMTPTPAVPPENRTTAPVVSRQDDNRQHTLPTEPSQVSPGRRIQSAFPAPADKHASPPASHHRDGASGSDNKSGNVRQKKVWKVTTSEKRAEKGHVE